MEGQIREVERQQLANKPRGKFLWKVFLMLFHPRGKNLFEWTADGAGVIVSRGPFQLLSAYIHLFFNHNSVASMMRQFNYYGFSSQNCKKTSTTVYTHPCFTRDACQIFCVRRTTFKGHARHPEPECVIKRKAEAAPPQRCRRRRRRAAGAAAGAAAAGAAAAGAAAAGAAAAGEIEHSVAFPWSPWSSYLEPAPPTTAALLELELDQLDYDEAQRNFLATCPASAV